MDIYIFSNKYSISTVASRRKRNHSIDRHSSRNLPLKLSSVPFCHGLPASLMHGDDARVRDPFQDALADELQPVVRAHE